MLNDVSSVVLQQGAADADTAHRNWLSSLSGRRKGRKVGAPRFRSKRDNRQAIRFTKNARFTITTGGKLRLPKIGDVRVRWSRENPRYLRKAERRLKRAQQALSRKEKGSKNRVKDGVEVARAHARVVDARRDFAHKLSTTIIRENQAVYVAVVLGVRGPGRPEAAECQVVGVPRVRDSPRPGPQRGPEHPPRRT